MNTRKHYGFLWLVWVLACAVTPITAQEQTPTPPPASTPVPEFAYIDAWQSYVLFPEAVLFRLRVGPPSDTELIAAVLTLDVPSLGEPQTIVIDLNDDEVVSQEATVTNIVYQWRFPTAADAPLAFEAINYQWDVTLSDGASERVLDTVVFDDHRSVWVEQTDATVPLRLVAPVRRLSLAGLMDALRPTVELLSVQATAPQDVQDVILYPGESITVACELNENGLPFVANASFPLALPCTPGKAIDIYQRSGYVIYDPATERVSTSRRLLVPLLVQQAYAPVWGAGEVPLWFQVGIEKHYDQASDKIRLLSPVLVASRNQQLFSLDGLADVPSPDDPAYAIWQAQSYGMVIYIAQRHGLETLYELARQAGRGDFPTIYADLTGESLRSLIELWQTWIFSDEAPAVYGLDLYGPPTVTPTPILSPTPRPPSLTPFPTFTPTATFPPTNTPVPPTETPTVTPRPAREVFTPTPRATAIPPAPPLIDVQVARWGFLGIIGVAVMLIAAALLFGRRR